jgi:transposase
MFQDEARFGRINEARGCWVPRNLRPIVGYQLIREYTYAYAAVSPHDGVMDSLILPEVNASLMSLFLKEVGRRHRDEFILMFTDGASWHNSKDLAVPKNMRLSMLPPYCAEINPVEHLWEEMREKDFANIVFHSMDAVEEQLNHSLARLENEKEKVASITGFHWIINIPLIAP